MQPGKFRFVSRGAMGTPRHPEPQSGAGMSVFMELPLLARGGGGHRSPRPSRKAPLLQEVDSSWLLPGFREVGKFLPSSPYSASLILRFQPYKY